MKTGISNLLKGIKQWDLSQFYTKDEIDDSSVTTNRAIITLDKTKIADAPFDGIQYLRKNGTWNSVNKLSGVGTITNTFSNSTYTSIVDTLKLASSGFDIKTVSTKEDGTALTNEIKYSNSKMSILANDLVLNSSKNLDVYASGKFTLDVGGESSIQSQSTMSILSGSLLKLSANNINIGDNAITYSAGGNKLEFDANSEEHKIGDNNMFSITNANNYGANINFSIRRDPYSMIYHHGGRDIRFGVAEGDIPPETAGSEFLDGIAVTSTEKDPSNLKNGLVVSKGVPYIVRDRELYEIGSIIQITYSNLKSLKDNSKLTPGQQYRITDYTCTTTQENTQSAGHVFDIIVTADDASTLNENARACKHSGDTYFANADLSAWELKYCLDNDTSRFAWADSTNGKGVIYYMKDDLDNECGYDFKNIMFKLKKLSSITWNAKASTDMQTSYNALFVGHYVGDWFTVNQAGSVTLSGTDVKYFYTFSLGEASPGEDTGDIVDGSMKGSNVEGDDNIYKSNVIPGWLPYDEEQNFRKLNFIVFKPFNGDDDDCNGNVFGKNCYNNVLGYSWTVNNTFGNSCYSNTFGNSCYSNTFGNECRYNTFGNSFRYNTFGNECRYNTFGNSCYSNTFGNECYDNTFGNGCGYNTFGNNCYSNTFGNSCGYNTFGNSCYNNKFGTSSTANAYYRFIRIESGNRYIYLSSTGTRSSSQYYQNVIIGAGVNNTSTYKTITDANVGQTYETKYVSANSQTITL